MHILEVDVCVSSLLKVNAYRELFHISRIQVSMVMSTQPAWGQEDGGITWTVEIHVLCY